MTIWDETASGIQIGDHSRMARGIRRARDVEELMARSRVPSMQNQIADFPGLISQSFPQDPASVDGALAQLLLDTQQSIVLGNSIGA